MSRTRMPIASAFGTRRPMTVSYDSMQKMSCFGAVRPAVHRRRAAYRRAGLRDLPCAAAAPAASCPGRRRDSLRLDRHAEERRLRAGRRWFRLVDPVTVATATLGLVKRHIGLLDKPVGFHLPADEEGDPHTHRRRDVLFGDPVGVAKDAHELL